MWLIFLEPQNVKYDCQLKILKINSFCLIVVEIKIFVYKIAKDSFWLLKIYIVIVHESVLINAREYRRGH